MYCNPQRDSVVETNRHRRAHTHFAELLSFLRNNQYPGLPENDAIPGFDIYKTHDGVHRGNDWETYVQQHQGPAWIFTHLGYRGRSSTFRTASNGQSWINRGLEDLRKEDPNSKILQKFKGVKLVLERACDDGSQWRYNMVEYTKIDERAGCALCRITARKIIAHERPSSSSEPSNNMVNAAHPKPSSCSTESVSLPNPIPDNTALLEQQIPPTLAGSSFMFSPYSVHNGLIENGFEVGESSGHHRTCNQDIFGNSLNNRSHGTTNAFTSSNDDQFKEQIDLPHFSHGFTGEHYWSVPLEMSTQNTNLPYHDNSSQHFNSGESMVLNNNDNMFLPARSTLSRPHLRPENTDNYCSMPWAGLPWDSRSPLVQNPLNPFGVDNHQTGTLYPVQMYDDPVMYEFTTYQQMQYGLNNFQGPSEHSDWNIGPANQSTSNYPTVPGMADDPLIQVYFPRWGPN